MTFAPERPGRILLAGAEQPAELDEADAGTMLEGKAAKGGDEQVGLPASDRAMEHEATGFLTGLEGRDPLHDPHELSICGMRS